MARGRVHIGQDVRSIPSGLTEPSRSARTNLVVAAGQSERDVYRHLLASFCAPVALRAQ